MHKRINGISKFWVSIKKQISQKGGISYVELKSLDVREFFILVVEFEAEVAREKANRKKAISRKKK